MFRQRPKSGTFYITEKFPHLATGGSVYTGTCPSFIPITQVCICFRKAVELLAVKSIVFCVTDIPFYNTFMFRSARYAGVCCKIPVHCELQVCFIKDRVKYACLNDTSFQVVNSDYLGDTAEKANARS